MSTNQLDCQVDYIRERFHDDEEDSNDENQQPQELLGQSEIDFPMSSKLQIYPTNGGHLTPGFEYDNDSQYPEFDDDSVEREKIQAQREYYLKQQESFEDLKEEHETPFNYQPTIFFGDNNI